MLTLVAALLAASGAARAWQGGRVEKILEAGRFSPFPLDSLPMTLGSWEGRDTTMDPQIVRVSGSTDLIARHYVDRRTGVGIDVLVLYGPASAMSGHTPEICYPAAGFEPLPGVFERPISMEREGASTVPFRSLAFSRGEGGLAEMQEVYYSLWYDGGWTTRSADARSANRIAGLYRVQACRRIAARERRDVDNPCEPFLAALVGEIEARMARPRPGAATATR